MIVWCQKCETEAVPHCLYSLPLCAPCSYEDYPMRYLLGVEPEQPLERCYWIIQDMYAALCGLLLGHLPDGPLDLSGWLDGIDWESWEDHIIRSEN